MATANVITKYLADNYRGHFLYYFIAIRIETIDAPNTMGLLPDM